MAGAGRVAVALKSLTNDAESETQVRARRHHHDPFRLAIDDQVQARQGTSLG
jgi:hypothetical protein